MRGQGRLYATLLAGLLFASCARNPESTLREPKVTANTILNLASLPRRSLLETGQRYSSEVKGETAEKQTTWWVQNPPIPYHYRVGFQWLNLSNLDNPHDGTWTFLVRDIERRHVPDKDDPMGRFIANYKCEVLTIKDMPK